MRILPPPNRQRADTKPPSPSPQINPASRASALRLTQTSVPPASGSSHSPGVANQIHGRCSVCRHKEARAIAMEVLSGASLRSVAERYAISKSALVRHTDHLPQNLIQARSSSQIADFDLLLAEIVRHKAGLEEMFEEAKQTMKRGEAAQISAVLLRTFDLSRKMIADEKGRTSQSNPASSEEITTLIGKIFLALEDYPDARIKLAEALSPLSRPLA